MLMGRSQRKCSKASARRCMAISDTWLVSMACREKPLLLTSMLASLTRSFTASTTLRSMLP